MVKVSYKYAKHPLVILEQGSYFGEISFLFKIRNLYLYKVRSSEPNTLLFSIKDNNLREIFNSYPEFGEILKVRAIRRHHYWNKLRMQ